MPVPPLGEALGRLSLLQAPWTPLRRSGLCSGLVEWVVASERGGRVLLRRHVACRTDSVRRLFGFLDSLHQHGQSEKDGSFLAKFVHHFLEELTDQRVLA